MLIIGIIGVLAIFFYFYLTRNVNYWEKRGVKQDKPVFFFGHYAGYYLLQKGLGPIIENLYRKFPNEKVVGILDGTHPQLIIRDPEILKRVLVTDFDHFRRRGLNPHETVFEPMYKNILLGEGDLWRLLRVRLTPCFTANKLRAMFPLIIKKATRLQEVTKKLLDNSPKVVDVKDLVSRYTVDVIGACAFGLDSDVLGNNDTPFMKLAHKIIYQPITSILKMFLKENFTELCKNLKSAGYIEKEIEELVSVVLKQRNYETSDRNDFIDQLIKCRKQGNLVGESIEKFKPDGTPEIVEIEFNDSLMAAQVFVFFGAGYDTSSGTTSYALHYLAFYPEVQKKAQEDIDRALAKHGGLSYEAINDMPYVKAVFNESARIFPSVPFVHRVCTKSYEIPELNLTIDRGTGIYGPLSSYNNDPKYYDEPTEFKPERFLDENSNQKQKEIFKPFGDGPRYCIGSRLGTMQSMAGLAAILSKFTVSPAPETKRELEVDPWCIITMNVKSITLIFDERKL